MDLEIGRNVTGTVSRMLRRLGPWAGKSAGRSEEYSSAFGIVNHFDDASDFWEAGFCAGTTKPGTILRLQAQSSDFIIAREHLSEVGIRRPHI